MKYEVVEPHQSEYPNPIRLSAGDSISIGEVYEGPEQWDNWYLCSAPGQEPGWVPMQVIRFQGDGRGVATEDYTAQELNVVAGDVVEGGRRLNGWVWCSSTASGIEGWVPEVNLKAVTE